MQSFVQKHYTKLFVFFVLLLSGLSYVLGYESASQKRVSSGESIVFSCQEDVLSKQKVLGVQKDLSDSSVKEIQNQNDTDTTQISDHAEHGAYVGSKNGTKYYTPGCPATNRIKPENYIWFQSVEDATLQGYSKGSC